MDPERLAATLYGVPFRAKSEHFAVRGEEVGYELRVGDWVGQRVSWREAGRDGLLLSCSFSVVVVIVCYAELCMYIFHHVRRFETLSSTRCCHFFGGL